MQNKNYASFSIRFFAHLFDLTFIWLVDLLVLYLLSAHIASISSVVSSSVLLLTFLVIVGLFFSLIYYSYFTSAFGGTLGKLLFGLRVEDEEGKNLSFKMSFFRHTVGYMVSNLVFGLGYYWVIRNKETRQGWHDGVSGSFVVVQNKNVAKSVLGAVLIIFLLFINTVLVLAVAKNIASSVPAVKKEVEDMTKLSEVKSIPQNGEGSYSKMPGSFERILAFGCKSTDPKSPEFLQMSVEDMPVYVDEGIIKISGKYGGMAVCVGNPTYLYLELSEEYPRGYRTAVNIYNNNSKELGHGGFSYLGLPGVFIKEGKDYKLSIIPLFSDGPSLVGSVALAVRGEKTFTFTNGQKFFANYQVLAIEGGDERVVSFFGKYSKPSEAFPGKLEVSSDNYDTMMADIKTTFFSDMSNLAEPEKSAVQRVETILGGLSAK